MRHILTAGHPFFNHVRFAKEFPLQAWGAALEQTALKLQNDSWQQTLGGVPLAICRIMWMQCFGR